MTSNRKDVKIHRATAEKHLNEIKARIKTVNSDPSFCYRVIRCVVFGSYVNAPEKEMLSDLDVAFKYEPKYPGDSPIMQAKMEECPSGDFAAQILWPLEEVRLYLRHGSGYVSLDRID